MSAPTELEILKLIYCGFSAKIVGTNKVVYGWKFPPTIGATRVPDLASISTAEELESDSHVNREVFVDFVKSWCDKINNNKLDSLYCLNTNVYQEGPPIIYNNINKLNDKKFQDKILKYQYNPFQILNDNDMMGLMDDIVKNIKL